MQGFRAWIMVWACMALTMNVQAQQSKPEDQQVLVSTHPMALLIKSAWPQLNVETLMDANQSPHDFALKPSHRRIIAQSDHLIWLGADFEPYLDKLVGRHSAALDLSSLFEEHHEVEHKLFEEDHSGHDHGANDPHIWLNPNGIEAILAQVANALSLETPNAFLDEFRQWREQAGVQLKNSPKGFVSFHDAFHYWVEYFNLNQKAVLAVNPEQPIGTRHIVKVRELLKQGNVACLFVEPQFKASIVDKLQQGTGVPVVRIDPIGSQYNVNEGKFLDFYRYLVSQFKTCLSAK